MFGRVRALQIVPVYDPEDGTALVNLGHIRYVGPRGTAGMIRQGYERSLHRYARCVSDSCASGS